MRDTGNFSPLTMKGCLKCVLVSDLTTVTATYNPPGVKKVAQRLSLDDEKINSVQNIYLCMESVNLFFNTAMSPPNGG